MVRKFTYICHFKTVEIKAKKLKQKTSIQFDSLGDVFVALAVVFAKAPYILESDSSILILLQARMLKCRKVSEFVGQNCLHYKTLHGVITLDFRFKIYRDLTHNRIHVLHICLKTTKQTH